MASLSIPPTLSSRWPKFVWSVQLLANASLVPSFSGIQWKFVASLFEISTGFHRKEVGALFPVTEQVYS